MTCVTSNWIPSERLRSLRDDQRARWQRGEKRLVETYVETDPKLAADQKLLIDFVYAEFCLREECGENPRVAEYLKRFPQLATELRPLLELHGLFDDISDEQADSQPDQSLPERAHRRMPAPATASRAVTEHATRHSAARGGGGLLS